MILTTGSINVTHTKINIWHVGVEHVWSGLRNIDQHTNTHMALWGLQMQSHLKLAPLFIDVFGNCLVSMVAILPLRNILFGRNVERFQMTTVILRPWSTWEGRTKQLLGAAFLRNETNWKFVSTFRGKAFIRTNKYKDVIYITIISDVHKIRLYIFLDGCFFMFAALSTIMSHDAPVARRNMKFLNVLFTKMCHSSSTVHLNTPNIANPKSPTVVFGLPMFYLLAFTVTWLTKVRTPTLSKPRNYKG